MGLIQRQASTAQGREGFPLAPRKQQGWRDGERAGKAGPSFAPRDGHSLAEWGWPGREAARGAPWHTLPPLHCHAGWLSLAAWPASQGKTHHSLFCSSAFSHLPPPLGSASQRWVDGRLSGAAASPTASPACLTKPAQEMLPFWAERFSLRAQLRGKILVFRFFRASSVLIPQQEQGGSWQGCMERQHSLLPPFQSTRQQFPLQHQKP